MLSVNSFNLNTAKMLSLGTELTLYHKFPSFELTCKGNFMKTLWEIEKMLRAFPLFSHNIFHPFEYVSSTDSQVNLSSASALRLINRG